jgi:tripartite-type tricarboxylate transporter receptor subunit TctC
MTIIRIAAILLALVGIATQERAAVAQAYPSKPVKLVVPYAPGGPTDIIARILAQKLAEGLGGSFFVENTAGAGGTIATGQAANAAADGTTILVANQDLIVLPIIKTKVPYDPFRSFLPVSLVVSAPEMIVVHPSLPAKTDRAAQNQSRQIQLRQPRLWNDAASCLRVAVQPRERN